MIAELATTTGDVSSDPRRRREFTLSADHARQVVEFTMDVARAGLPFGDWDALAEQAREPNPSAWAHNPRFPPPMGSPEMRPVAKELSTTPSFQLFLAGIDIAQRVGLVTNSNAGVTVACCNRLLRWVPSYTARGGLFFLPSEFLLPGDDAALDELESNNKICRCRLTVDGAPPSWYGAYIPYATPIGFVQPVSAEAELLWEKIRNYYYAFR